jgi:hypothetical protein
LDDAGLLRIGNTAQRRRGNAMLNQLFVELTRRKKRPGVKLTPVRIGDEALVKLARPLHQLFYLKRKSSAASGSSSNCALSLRTFPTALSTFQAIIWSAGKGRSRSKGGCAGLPAPNQRA